MFMERVRKTWLVLATSAVWIWYDMIYDMIYLLTAIWLTPGGSSTVHIYTQTIQRTTQLTTWEECGPCPVFVIYTLAFPLQLRKKHEKSLSQDSRRTPVGTMKTEYTEQSIHNNKNTQHNNKNTQHNNKNTNTLFHISPALESYCKKHEIFFISSLFKIFMKIYFA
jgi:hypothetical protein